MSDKNFKFRNFYRAEGIFLSPVLTVSLKMVVFMHESMEHHPSDQPAVILFAKKNFAKFSSKAEIIEFFRNRFDTPHCPLRFSTLTLTF